MTTFFNFLFSIDIRLFDMLHRFAYRSEYADLFLAYLAEGIPYLLVGSILIFFFFRQRNPSWMYSVVAAVISRAVFAEIVKRVVNRSRPFEVFNFPVILFERDAAFPSGHATFLFALAFFLIFSGNRKLGFTALLLAFLNGFARIILGLHWPFDVAAGMLIGAGVAWLLAILARHLHLRL